MSTEEVLQVFLSFVWIKVQFYQGRKNVCSVSKTTAVAQCINIHIFVQKLSFDEISKII